MTWDLGLEGVGVLAVMSIVFGLFAELVAARWTTVWIGLIAAVSYFVCGSLVSEAWFGWATEEELQPNIDGLSFDEVLLLTTLPLLVAVLTARHIGRKRRLQRSALGAPLQADATAAARDTTPSP
jgi:phosphoglycerol transferase MdoB-like AlkP superfamily enzyme